MPGGGSSRSRRSTRPWCGICRPTKRGGWSMRARENSGGLCRRAILTGCRYSELTRLTCGDYNPDSRTLAIKLAKGRIRHVVLTDDGDRCFAAWTAGKGAQERVFLRDGRRCLGEIAAGATARDRERDCKDLAAGEFPCAAAYPRQSSRDARGAVRRHRAPARPFRHAHDRKTLCAPRAELCRRDDTGEVSKPGNRKRGNCDRFASGSINRA